jgi:hypothetical protein
MFDISVVRRHRWVRTVTVVAMLSLASAQQTVAAETTWAQRLGYPADAKVVIFNAREMGLCYETSAAAAKLIDAKLIRSADLMAPCPWFGHAAKWSRAHRDIDFGLSLTFTSEWEHYRWRPVSPRSEVPGLINAEGYFWKNVLRMTFNATAEDVEREINAQIRAAQRAGVPLGHLSTHQGALFMRPDLAQVYLGLARKYWIPAVVIELTPAHIEQFRKEGFPLDDKMIDLIAGYPLPKLDDMKFLAPADSLEASREVFLRTIDGLSPGLTQIVFHPAVDSAALRRLTRGWQQRVWDAQLLTDPAVQKRLKEQRIIQTDWKEIMRRFEGTTPRAVPTGREAAKPVAPPRQNTDTKGDK